MVVFGALFLKKRGCVLLGGTAAVAAALGALLWLRPRRGGEPQRYPIEEARVAAVLSRLIYFAGADEVIEDAATGARMAVVPRPERRRVYIVFSGTDGAADAARAMDATPVKTDIGVLTHRGFYAQFRALRPALVRAIAAVPPDAAVVFCGHSMGAALAAIAALHVGPGPRRTMCLMFNSPAVGDTRFRAAFDAACPDAWHFTSPHDPVTMLTYNPRLMHVGRPVYYDPVLRAAFAGDGALPLLLRLRPPSALDGVHHLLVGLGRAS